MPSSDNWDVHVGPKSTPDEVGAMMSKLKRRFASEPDGYTKDEL